MQTETNTITLAPFAAPGSRAILSSKGTQCGTEFDLGENNAKSLKKQLKALHPTASGKELKKLVNEALSGQADVREINAMAFIKFARTNHNLVPDLAQLRKSGGAIKLVKIEAPADAKVEALQTENEDLKARLAKLEALVAGNLS